MSGASKELASASRGLGEETLAAIMRDRVRSGARMLLDPLVDAAGGQRRAGSGTFDGVTLTEGDPPKLTVYEVKGGNSSKLGSRDVDGVRAEQGTARYFNDVAAKDPELAAQIKAYMDSPDADPVTVERLRSGEIELEYELIEVRPTRQGSSGSGIRRTGSIMTRTRSMRPGPEESLSARGEVC